MWVISSRPMLLARRPEKASTHSQSTWQILEDNQQEQRELQEVHFLPLLLLWIIPHQLHKMHFFRIRKSPLTLPRSSQRKTKKASEISLEISPKGESHWNF